MSIVAYQGEVEFDGCFWDDQNGWRVRWRLLGTPEAQGKANPMKRFTKRRGDRVGTRFQAVFQPVAFGQAYSGEVMLVAWSDSTSGWSVTFEHADEPAFAAGLLRRGRERVGSRYMGVLAEVDADDQVVDQQQRERVETAQHQGRRALALSNRAALFTKNPRFLGWLRENIEARDWTADQADIWLKTYLEIESKADLDDMRNTRARKRYQDLTGLVMED